MHKWDLAHSNQLQQLLVSVSRHLYVQKNGLLKYQEKPLAINLSNLKQSSKEHLVYYILRDALSGSFFLEIATSQTMIPLLEFLYRSWEKNTGKYLWGLPECLSVPRGLASAELLDGLGALGVQVTLPASGFAAGVRVLKDIENDLLFQMGRFVDHRPQILDLRCKEKMYQYLLGLHFEEQDNKHARWLAAIPRQGVRDVPDRKSFMSCFQEEPESIAGVLWLKQESSLQVKVPIWEQDPWPPFDEKRYNRAAALLCDADEHPDRDVRLNTAWEALRISPYCTDAYNLLAEKSAYPDDKIFFYEKGVKAGRLALGDAFIRENAGHFWLITETRPYMMALRGYADCLRQTGALDRAIDIFQELLHLNPGDNQANRYKLSACLLEAGKDDLLRMFMARYGDENSCFITYDKALWTFRFTGGANDGSNKMLAEALTTNRHVPPYLLSEKCIPPKEPVYYSCGDEDEAQIYAFNSRKAWQQTPGALEWLQNML
jgi:tetratricopeptide (TPR) repeat protein